MSFSIPKAAAAAPLTPLHGILLSLLTALVAELVLRNPLSYGETGTLMVGRVMVVFLSLFCVHHFALKSLNNYKPMIRDFIYLNLILVISVLVIQAGLVVAMGLSAYSKNIHYLGGIEPQAFYFALPFAAGGLLLQTILGLHYSLVFSISIALITGVYITDEPLLIAFALVSTLAGCLSLTRFRSRAMYTRAGFNIVLIALPFALASGIIHGPSTPGDILVRVLGALACGGLCSFMAAGFTPTVEYLGGYVTDLRLIEMATLDHPLLRSLSVNAPGTWNHSMVMGMMAEAAAEAIGANPVVARVGAYFHDIGKTKKPLYFVENQSGTENRHEKLSTSMSALIIRSHVKDGVELALKHKLPGAIVDMIPQHHGTARIEYFYEKACSEAEEAGGLAEDVDPVLYSYPGPKPQSREAGILMLADGIEAASRTISEPTLDRVQGLVQKMINKVFSSGQLNECELTLNDLHSIAASFTRVLNGIYHQRIAYAEPAEKIHSKEDEEEQESAPAASEQKEMEGAPAAKKHKEAGAERHHKEGGAEDLKRLGLQKDPRTGARTKPPIH